MFFIIALPRGGNKRIKSIKSNQSPDMTTAVDWDVKQLFKQTNIVIFNEQAHYVINIFVYPWFCYDIVPCNTNGKIALCKFFISIHA